MAKRFEFRLETLLRVRSLREREAERRAAEIRAELARLDEADRAALDAIGAQQAELVRLQSAGADPVSLARGRAWIAYLRRQMGERAQLRNDAIKRLHGRLQELREARKQKRMIEKLRERQFEIYRRTRSRWEQSLADENAQNQFVLTAADARDSAAIDGGRVDSDDRI